jgi:protein involved in polysaccharide export with SLBB domain
MIHYAGGRKQDASETVGIHKIKPKSERTNGISYEAHYVDFESTKLIPAANVDQISVRYLFHELRQVEIIGQVKVPGHYHYYEGMTFKNLLKLSGGLEDSTYAKSVYLGKAEIIRRNPDSRYDEVISVKLGVILNNDTEKKIVLHNLDRVVVHANSNFFEKEHVQILGEVNIPGSYPLISDNETLQSVLNRAGNFTSKAMKDGIAIYRDRKYFEVTASQATLLSDGEDREDGKVRVAWQNVSVTLMPGDSVVVKESPGTVNVFGQVYNSGLIEFRRGKGLKYYIDGAGGVTEQGNKKSIIVVYANGVVSPNKWYSTPKIEDGATIIVNKKPSSEPFNPTEFASTLASFLSSIVTIMVLSKQL